MAKLKRQHELELKELEEAEELARNYIHQNTADDRIDLNMFNKNYQDKMIARERKKALQ